MTRRAIVFTTSCASVHDELHADLRRRLEALDEPVAADQVTELGLGLNKKIRSVIFV
jgi:hypothetical protein